MLTNDHWIEENFLQILITDKQKTILVLEDVQKMSAMSFVALLGGTLNLYSGLTIVVLVEILEAIIRLVVPCCKSMRNRVTSNPKQNQEGADESRNIEHGSTTEAWIDCDGIHK